MSNHIVISTGRTSTLLALFLSPIIIMSISIISSFSGKNLRDGVYYLLFGDFIFLIFYGGLIYATYEFYTTFKNRSKYVIVKDGFLYVFNQSKIKIDDIGKVYIRSNLISGNVIIEGSDKVIRIRSHFLNEKPESVVNNILNQKSGQRQSSAKSF